MFLIRIGLHNITKATFYTFYNSKEAFYLDIVQRIQLKIYQAPEHRLEMNTGLNNRQRVRQLFACMYTLISQYPILVQINKDTTALIARKIRPERLALFTGPTLDTVSIIMKHRSNITAAL